MSLHLIETEQPPNILSIDLADLQKQDPLITEDFLNELFRQIPQLGVLAVGYWLINTMFTINNSQNLAVVNNINTFIGQANMAGFTSIQITKNINQHEQ